MELLLRRRNCCSARRELNSHAHHRYFLRRPISEDALLWIARVGYAGRGSVFLLLGIFTGLAALGLRWQPVSTAGALHSVAASSAGAVLVFVIAAGLFCFAFYRSIEAAWDVHNYGDDSKGAFRRVGLSFSGFFYAGFGFIAASAVFGSGASANDQTVRNWTAWVLGMPVGTLLVGIVGLIVIGMGIRLAISGWCETFASRVRFQPKERPYAAVLGQVGFVARSVIMILIGGFLLFAAITADPHHAQGLAGTLRTIQHQTFGDILLGLMAIGLLCFGAFGISEAAFAKIEK